MDADDFPLLGEPLAVELANTRYLDGADVIDFLAPRERAEAWARHALAGQTAPRRWSAAAAGQLRELRDAVFELLSACASGGVPSAAAIANVNASAATACAHAALDWPDTDVPRARVEFCGEPLAVVTARFATSCIEVVIGHPEHAVRRCEGPGCALLFVQRHGRRRFCHAGCSHRARQRRYVNTHRENV